jgi:hypothetical protein
MKPHFLKIWHKTHNLVSELDSILTIAYRHFRYIIEMRAILCSLGHNVSETQTCKDNAIHPTAVQKGFKAQQKFYLNYTLEESSI